MAAYKHWSDQTRIVKQEIEEGKFDFAGLAQ